MLLLWLTVVGYLLMQTIVIVRATGRSRLLAALPLIVMIPVLLWTYHGYRVQSNLWPLLLLFTSPFALLYVLTIALNQPRLTFPRRHP